MNNGEEAEKWLDDWEQECRKKGLRDKFFRYIYTIRALNYILKMEAKRYLLKKNEGE